ncbi:DUF6194 family protein [Microbacterium esteraromaticum]|uniref:DUF6194 family protein n=1 Tax=Microbacterium esteraromaticum TaxID=57043 RepID=UPI001C970417|nr:DUF6194 family protein [Microbacterium esteraromaticum]MBY6060149.1 hypothetical protein [Microbacterium esteraromaticum]
MDIQQIIDAVRGFDSALVIAPDSEPHPELTWGDAFFYFAPTGVMPERTQPYATITTKDYPDDTAFEVGRDRFRVNIHVGRDRVTELSDADVQPTGSDAFLPHPLYGAMGWVCVVNPGERTAGQVLDLLRDAHDAARARMLRREQGA